MAKERVIQRHHLSYTPDVSGELYKGEHEILTKINLYTRKNVSSWFLKCLEVFIALNKDRAIDLDSIKED